MAHYYICLHPLAKWFQNPSKSMMTQIISHKAQNTVTSWRRGQSHSFNGHNYNLTINTGLKYFILENISWSVIMKLDVWVVKINSFYVPAELNAAEAKRHHISKLLDNDVMLRFLLNPP